MTRQETIVTYLTQAGCREVKSVSRKYRKFTTKPGITGEFYFIGRQGAVRKGRSVSSSISLTAFVNYKKIQQKLTAQKGAQKC